MRKKSNNNFLFMMIILLLLGIGLGYAIIHSDLILNGTANIGSNTWDIHFENVQVANGSVDATTPAVINPSDNTKVNYAITLEKPGDYYEFEVDIVNAGTLPGKISLYSITGIDSQYEDIIEYSINYDDGSPVQVGDILNDGATKTIKVRTYFNENIDEDDLPEDDFNLDLEVEITYVQSDERGPITLNQAVRGLPNTCLTKYNGNVTDQVGVTTAATKVYFDGCTEQRHVIFGGYCWNVIRTTETGGTKLIYDGEQVEQECDSYRMDYNTPFFKNSTIGKAQFNSIRNSLAMVGYMHNTIYDYQIHHLDSTEYKYGNSFTYDTNTGTYTLSGTTQNIGSWGMYTSIANTHYTCWNTSGTCSSISYIFYKIDDLYYINIDNGKSIEDAVNEMLYDNNVNTNNSTIKDIIDDWYESHLYSSYNDYVEDTIYCNDRSLVDWSGLNPNGGNIWETPLFKNADQSNTDLSCLNITDQFAVSNNKAKLTYPVGMVSLEEYANAGDADLFEVDADYWTISPSYGISTLTAYSGNVIEIDYDGYTNAYGANEEEIWVRPVISLKNNVVVTGTGTETDPWIVE